MKSNNTYLSRNRATKGFTLMEVIIAVAILVILMGVASIAVVNYQRTLKQHELDGIARELFITAQNHLSMAQSQGVLKDVNIDDEAQVGEKDQNNESSDLRYWYVGENKSSLLTGKKNTLQEMLPFGSIDDTVRLGGSYVIKYNVKTARILSVFYSDLQRLSEHEFKSRDYETLFPGLEGAENKDARLRVDAFGGQVIGWYGGDDLDSSDVDYLPAPALKINNAERLEVTATFTLEDYLEYIHPNGEIQMNIVIRGDTSKVSKIINVEKLNNSLEPDGDSYSKSEVLDDITADDEQHFQQLQSNWTSESGSDDQNLIPGENISVYAEVFTNNALANIAKSATKHTNSLFAGMVEDEVGGEGLVATISNIRHLENLDAAISGYDLGKLGADGTTKAKQVSDLRWAPATKNDSKKPVAFTRAISEDNYDSVQIYPIDTSESASNEGTFMPITPQAIDESSILEPYELEYDGNGKKISNVKIETDDADAGIFESLPSGSTVHSLELVDCSVTAGENGSAGALLGAADESITITDVLVHDSTGSVESTITGTDSVGGLIGKLTASEGNTITIDGCGASVLVESSGNAAGGLVGTVKDNVTISNSYAGGHTKAGTGMYDPDPDKSNVKGTGSSTDVGGLVGNVKGQAAIQYCYATTSVSSEGTAGGLVGSASDATIKNCYATGLVAEGAQKGAFIGEADSSTLDTNTYYEIINYDTENEVYMVPVGGGISVTEEQITALDKDIDAYEAFYTDARESGVNDVAVPYDSRLTELYNKTYPLRTIAMLNKDADGMWATSHYGDWPAPETLIINTKP